MNIKGYVICVPVNTWGDETKDKWWPRYETFGKTPHESWIRFLGCRPEDDDTFDRKRNHYVGLGYCVKETTMEVNI